MKKFLAAVFSVLVCSIIVMCAACKPAKGQKKPEKLKDGIALVLTEGGSKSIDLTEYISIEGTEFGYEVSSSNDGVATATLSGNTATVTAVSKGSATVTASADEVSVTFAVTVSPKQQETGKADKTALAAELALEITAQGDYTTESYAAYTQKLQAAKTVNAKTDATQSEVDTACNELKTAREGLTLRVPAEVAGADKTLVIVSGLSKEITVSDYVDAKNLSGITYEISCENSIVTVGGITEGKFTVSTTKTEQDIDVPLTICVKYKGESKLTVTLTLQVKSEPQPTVKQSNVTQPVDIYKLENKTGYKIDFTQNVESNGVENLAYSVTSGGDSVTLDGDNCFVYNFDGTYSENATEVVYNVTVNYGESKSVSYVYTLKITDTSAFRVANGGFDSGLDDWTLSNPALGGVNDTANYWSENIPFNNDDNFFNAYAEGSEESAKGTLTSSPFKIGGSGWITYKLGGAKNADKVYLDIIENSTGKILARYYNNAFSDDLNSTTVRGCTLVAYKADLSAHIGKTVYIRLSDNAINDYGLFFADSFETYYAEAPTEGNTAVPVTNAPENIYQLLNGGFDYGLDGLDGWTLSNPALGGVNNTGSYWNNDDNPDGIPFNNDGKFFNAYAEGSAESAMGTLTSSLFTIGGSGWITYKLGGAKNADKVYLDIIENSTGKILARYYNNAFSDDLNSTTVRGCTLVAYKADLSAHIGKTVYIRLSDNAINDYGLFFVDSFETYHAEAPTEGNAAVPVSNAPENIYQLLNGGFDEDLNGWTVVTTDGPENEIFGALGNADATWGDNSLSYNNDGKFFQNMNEGCKGYLTSTSFTVSENGWMSFKLGGNKAHSYVSIIDANTGAELARFVNKNYVGAWPNNGWEMYSYKVNLIESGIAAGTEVRIKVVDDATNDYGVVVVDSFALHSSDPGESFQKINKVS